MKQTLARLASILLSATLGACSQNLPSAPGGAAATMGDRPAANPARGHSDATVFTGAGDITAAVNAFRDALGTLNANLPGSQAGGRREINWDAVPAQFTNTNDFPVDFFNQPVAGRARGTVFSTPGTGFRTSDDNFADVAPSFDGPFNFFSPIRTFMPVDSRRMTVHFFVPGSSDAATSTGFGVVFSDVDREGSASIRLFDSRGRSLGQFVAPTAPGAFSFVGVKFSSALVARVEIRSGQAAVVTTGTDRDNLLLGTRSQEKDDDHGEGDDDHDRRRNPDLVIMDDFIYGEPMPTTTASAASALSNAGVNAPAQSAEETR